MTREIKLTMLGAGAIVVLFCSSFVFFFSRIKRTGESAPRIKTGQVFPRAVLQGLDGETLDDQSIRSGKVIVVFLSAGCPACEKEGRFLQTVASKRPDLRYLGIVSFGGHESLEQVKSVFPFKSYYDSGARLAMQLGITKVPMKIFLRDGKIQRVWGGATGDDEKKDEYLKWLGSLD